VTGADPADGGGSALVAGVSVVGRARPVNEDALAMSTRDGDGWRRIVAVVCDGIAGGAHGELASAAAAAAAHAALAESDGAPPDDALRLAVALAHRAVCEAGIEEERGKERAGTTLVAAIARPGAIHVAWVGDSRAYLVSDDGEAEQLTHDHSWVNMVVDAGDLSIEDALASRWSQVITRCVGPAEDPDPLKPPEPSLRSLDVATGATLVLCSDGLSAEFPDAADLAAAVRAAPDPTDPDSVAGWLVGQALARGADDDITVVVVRL